MEQNETFTVNIVSIGPNTIVSRASTTVLIIDNDGKRTNSESRLLTSNPFTCVDQYYNYYSAIEMQDALIK